MLFTHVSEGVLNIVEDVEGLSALELGVKQVFTELALLNDSIGTVLSLLLNDGVGLVAGLKDRLGSLLLGITDNIGGRRQGITLNNCNVLLEFGFLTLNLGKLCLRLLLLGLRLRLLVRYLGRNQRVLPLLAELDVDDLEADAIGIQLLQRLVDGNAKQLSVLLTFVPEGVLLPPADGLTNSEVNFLNEVTLIVRLQEVVEFADAFLVKFVLD